MDQREVPNSMCLKTACTHKRRSRTKKQQRDCHWAPVRIHVGKAVQRKRTRAVGRTRNEEHKKR